MKEMLRHHVMLLLRWLALVLPILKFNPKRLEGRWHQLATNDPTIPSLCKNQTLYWKLNKNQKEYEIDFHATCGGGCIQQPISVSLHGDIKNFTFYENFKSFPKVYRNQVVSIEVVGNTYNIVELIAEIHLFGLFKKRIYQLWCRKPIPVEKIKNYIQRAQETYNVTHVRIM